MITSLRFWRLLAVVLAAVLLPASAVAAEWTPFGAGSGAVCADGSAADYFEYAADPARVVLYLEGGGGCFSADTCAFDNQDQLYFAQSLATPEWLSERDGIFDFGDPRNPLAGYSFVYVPYCTGDIHVGNATTTYAPDVIVEHRGYPNGLIAVEHLASTYPAATEVVVTGISAGSAAAPLYAGLVADTLPEARIVSLADSSGGYPDIAALNGLVGSLWGTMAAVPDWPSTEGMTAREWSLPGLYGVVAAHAPETVFGKFDHAYDGAQVFYAGLAGLEADELLMLIDENGARMEADGAEVAEYIAPGDGHTILDTDAIYDLEVEGVRFIDWLTELIEGVAPADVRCADCR
jgi:hypothetical protein